jgi:thiol-disulfide isomerase/thioredoxin
MTAQPRPYFRIARRLCGFFLVIFSMQPVFGTTASNFTVPRHGTSQNVSLYDYAGYVIVLDFFAYWCGPCQSSSPLLETEVSQYYASRGGNAHGVPVKVIAVNIEMNSPSLTDQFIANAGLEFVVDDVSGLAWSQFGLGYIPHFVVINGTTGGTYPQWEVLHTNYGWRGSTFYRGIIDQVDGQPPVLTFANWAAAHSLPAGKNGPSDAPDGDGVPNLVKFASGLLPGSRCSTAPAGACSRLGGALPTFSFQRAKGIGGITETIQIKRGNASWETWVPPDSSITTTSQTGYNSLTISLDFPAEKTLMIRRSLAYTP